MIVVFVIDTSPSMTESVRGGLSKLDVAKMFVEQTVRGLKKRMIEHNTTVLLQSDGRVQEALRNIGLGYQPTDEILLLATGRQHTDHPATATCGAGGRLLVGFGCHPENSASSSASGDNNSNSNNKGGSSSSHTPTTTEHNFAHAVAAQQHGVDAFQRELKQLKASKWTPGTKFPDDGGGAKGLNIALSAGLQLLSRYRLRFKATENFAMGRLPSSVMLHPSGGTAAHALQPACLILLTDGMCLCTSQDKGGGSLQLQSGALLREFYREPFRWDQRIFCVGVGGKEGMSSSQYLHPQLRALSEVTGGSHMMMQSSVARSAELLLKLLAPPRPVKLVIPDPFQNTGENKEPLVGGNGSFVNGGPVCCFQSLERDFDGGQAPSKTRASLLYVPHQLETSETSVEMAVPAGSDWNAYQPPIWPIAENYFPNRKLETLPPRPAEPLLLFSIYPQRLGSKLFDAASVMKMVHRLDQIGKAIKEMVQPIQAIARKTRILQRDTYICEWISAEGKAAKGPNVPMGMEYFPVLVQGAGRPTLNDGDGSNWLSTGILHTPPGTSSLASSLATGFMVSTITLLPPEPNILLPLLLRAVEAEHKALRKAWVSEQKLLDPKKAEKISRTVQMDDAWRNEVRGYLFRLPPYYIAATKRCLKSVLPSGSQSLLTTENAEMSLQMNSYSKTCHQKIRNAEIVAKSNNDRLERQEAELRRRGTPIVDTSVSSKPSNPKGMHGQSHDNRNNTVPVPVVGHGQYDPRTSVDSYLAALKHMPPPWKAVPGSKKQNVEQTKKKKKKNPKDQPTMVDILGDLPARCLMAYYESRRRWIFGGSGLSTRGLFVEGVQNDGSNSQRCSSTRDRNEQSLLSLAGVGVSQMNETTTAKMGDYRERLLWSRAPIVGTGANDATGVSSTTTQDGSPAWSVEDDAMPISFFDPKTGEFADSMEARIRSRLMVNFGNPFKDKRGDSIVPEAFSKQRPRRGDTNTLDGPLTPPTSPPHDAYNSADEGEGEAVFSGVPSTQKKSPRRSPSRNDNFDDEPATKKIKTESPQASPKNRPPPPPPRSKEGNTGPPRPPPPPPPPRRQSSVTPPPPPATCHSSSQTPQNTSQDAGSPKQPRPATGGAKPNPVAGTVESTTKKNAPPPPPPKSGQSRPNPMQQVNHPQQARRRSLSQATQNMDMQSPDKKPNVDLPPQWICVWSKSQKRWYFFDQKNNKSVWQWPPPS